ncbi:MurR/RpiR family transcriptional regulator [Qingshengfaniella alkalisoli]|uniref:MurR/RpiR family transcriptional regulator n=1 Tax=Qingshengfaniella alkalisoli TaxID=2599296 RepID=A0A5B8I934_9RHOB|nr:MurR/RpiR family transcriptional regulator [Qingshengfaniella alkalisoli]QDY70675.1 MurR/RpiR family transcriptional regulator [Qingshengfaniella alkalisoli]
MSDQDLTQLHSLISKHSEKLTPADARILDVLISDPIRAAMQDGKEVSDRAGVHPSSAVRLARRLGFSGYRDLKAFLQDSLTREHGDFIHAESRIAARLARSEERSLVQDVLDSEIATLQAARDTISDTDIRHFSEAVMAARRVFLFGQGHGAAIAKLVEIRLQRSGYDARDMSGSDQQMAEQIASMTARDVVWIFAFRQISKRLQRMHNVLVSGGVKTLVISDIRAARFLPKPTLQINVSRGAPGEHQSIATPMTIANGIILDLARIDDGQTLNALSKFTEVRQSMA